MLKIRRSNERGHANHGWLDARHTFSFADYHDPDWMSFGPLRVINQDQVQPAKGFATHGHQDMEIVTYVIEGVLEHKDSMGNGSQVKPGEVQFMSAGTGVTHSEFNASQHDALHLLQMWILPRQLGTPPRYEQKSYPESERRGALRLVVSPDGTDGSITIGQDARLYASLLAEGEIAALDLAADRQAWLHVARGSMRMNGEVLEPGDGVGAVGEPRLELEGIHNAEFVVWEVPA